MNIEDVARTLGIQIRKVCDAQSRYRVLLIVGEPRSGKTTLCRYICLVQRWRYVNFTLDAGFLDSLIGREETYRPSDFLADLSTWCASTSEEFVIFDEIESVLGLWNWEQQEIFFKSVGWTTGLSAGVVLVTRARTAQQLRTTLSGMNQDHVYEIPQGVIL